MKKCDVYSKLCRLIFFLVKLIWMTELAQSGNQSERKHIDLQDPCLKWIHLGLDFSVKVNNPKIIHKKSNWENEEFLILTYFGRGMSKLAQPASKAQQPAYYGLGSTFINKIAILCTNWYSSNFLPDWEYSQKISSVSL